MTERSQNPFLDGSLIALYLRTALPITMLLAVHGFIAIADAWFLGNFSGPDALAAVTLTFPFYMGVVALSAIVSAGSSSLVSRSLGAGRRDRAREVLVGAHGLSLAICLGLILVFAAFGGAAVRLAAGGNAALADAAMSHLRITVWTAGLTFLLTLRSRALQDLGLVRLMAGMSLTVSGANIAFDAAFIVGMGLGVTGSALGTAAAQIVGLAMIHAFGPSEMTRLSLADIRGDRLLAAWRGILVFGASHGLGLLSASIAALAVIGTLQRLDVEDYAATVTAYGIVTRIQSFAFLPLLGLSQAMQSISGNNHGAGDEERVATSLRIALAAALLYGLGVQLGLFLTGEKLGVLFVTEATVAAKLSVIVPLVFLTFCLAGPLMVLSGHFRAVGDARMSMLLGLSRPYLFVIPLIALLPRVLGEHGVWLAWALGDALLLALACVVLRRRDIALPSLSPLAACRTAPGVSQHRRSPPRVIWGCLQPRHPRRPASHHQQ